MRAIAFGQDGSFSWEDLAARYQAELANGFGNLASRVIAMTAKYFDGAVPSSGPATEAELSIQRTIAEAVATADAAIARFAIHDAIAAIWTIVDALNGYITEQEPWKVAKDESQEERLRTILYTSAEGLRALAVLLSPVLPQATQKLWAALGAETGLGALVDQRIPDAGAWGLLPAGSATSALEALFPRIEHEATA
jgi:methionyl-tRNA synthetase